MTADTQRQIEALDGLAIDSCSDTRWEHDDFLDKQIPPSPEGKTGDRQ